MMSRLHLSIVAILACFMVAPTSLIAIPQQFPLDQQRAAHAARTQAMRSLSRNGSQMQISRIPLILRTRCGTFAGTNPPPTNIRFLGASRLSLGDRIAVGQPVQGDFNGDGKLDATVIAYDCVANSYYLAMLAGNDDGTFQAPVYTLLGTAEPSDTLIAGDLNGDGRTDVVVLYGYDGSAMPASAYTGNTNGTFTLSSGFTINDQTWPSGATLAHLNGDVNLDLLVVVNANVHTLLGNGDGTFGADNAVSLGDGSLSPAFPVFADVNGDGKLDVVGTDGVTSLLVFLANGTGGYNNGVAYQWPNPTSQFMFVSVSDINGDGYPDAVIADLYGDQAVVYLNNSDGSFAAPAAYSTGYGSHPTAIGVADIDGDGKADLISVNANSADITTLAGNGDGTFNSATVGYASSDFPNFLPLVGYFAGDGKLDVILSDQYFNLLYMQGYGDGTFRAAHTLYTPLSQDYDSSGQAWSWDIAAGDLNGDGKADTVVGDCCNSVVGVSVFLGNGDGTFQTPAKYGSGGGLEYVALADMNGDGKLDIVAADLNYDNISIFLNNGDGTFPATPATYDLSGIGSWPLMMSTGDFNGDGHPDVAVLMNNSQVAIMLNNGSGGLLTPVSYPLSASPVAIATADVNNDGKLDLVIAEVDGTIGVLLGNGDGTFQPASELTNVGAYPQDLTLADFDGDGNLDLAATSLSPSEHIALALGNGDGTFGLPMNIAATTHSGTQPALPAGIRAADIDGDGKLDLVWANSNYSTVAIAYGIGNGSFYDPVEIPSGGYPAHLAITDFNRDGALDVVTANEDMVGMSLLLNAGGNQATMSASPNPAYVGQPVNVTAQVTATVRGASGTPSGTVSFQDGGAPLGTATLDGSGSGSITISTLSAGSHTITGAYSGDVNFLPSSGIVAVIVNTPSSPTVTTAAISGITPTAASAGGNVTSDGGASVTARGVCWNISPNPTTGNSCTSDGTGTGAFTSSISGLTAATTYYVRAYATNSIGTSYGSDVSFTTSAALGYSISASPMSASIKAGTSATFTLTVTPVNGFDSLVSFSCGGFPEGASCSFNPPSVRPNGGPVTSTLRITTTSTNVAEVEHSNIGLTACFSLFGCFLAGSTVRGRRRRWVIGGLAVVTLMLVSLVGCGSNNTINPNPTPPGSYTIQVSATGGTAQQLELTLDVH